MKTLIKKYIERMLIHKLILLITVSLSVAPFTLKAQPEEHRSDQGALVGTSDSRMFITIDEAENHVEFKVSLLGELTARSLNFILLYDTAKLRLTDETYLYDIPDGFGVNDYSSSVVTIPAPFSSQYPDHFMMPRRHRAIFSGDALGMKYFITEMINYLPTSEPIYLNAGEVIHAYSIYCRKVNPGTPITHSDIGYYAQIQEVAHEPLPVQAPYWTYDATAIRFANGMPATLFKTKSELFTYRSPSYVVTENTTQIYANTATFNATFTRGDLMPRNDMMVTGYVAAQHYGRLTWDTIAQCGFIYSNTDANILVNGYSKKINIDGDDYDFPNAAEIAAGEFIRNGKIFYITQTNNSSSNQTVSYSQTATGLASGDTYYVWSFIQYVIETSDPYLYVGNKTVFEQIPDCEVNPVAFAENLIYCSGDEVPEYTFTGTENTTFFWERVVGYDFGLDATAGINTIPAFVAQNYGFEYISAIYKVTPVDEHGCVGETKNFLITVNPKPHINTLPAMVYCNGEQTPNIDLGNAQALYTWQLINGVNVGLAESGTGQLPSFIAVNNSNSEILQAIYEVTATVNMYGHECTHSVTFNIIVNPTPSVATNMSDAELVFCDNDNMYLFVTVEDNVQYQWFFNGNILQGETAAHYETIFDNTKEGEYAVEVSYECGTEIYYFNVIQNPVTIKMKWDDVMYVSNSENIYVSYQWYKNGKPISGKDQYYSESGGFTPGAAYYARAFKADGSYDETCPFRPNVSDKTEPSLTIYPNPTQSDKKTTFVLKLPTGQEPDAEAYIYDMTGRMVAQFRITNYVTEVALNVATGAYAVKVITTKGNIFTEKIIIQK